MVDAGIHLQLVPDISAGKGIAEGRHRSGDAVIEFGVDAQDGRLDGGDFVQVRGGTVKRRGGLQPGQFRRRLPRDAAAEAVARHGNPPGIDEVL
jgi:hypothetical protein